MNAIICNHCSRLIEDKNKYFEVDVKFMEFLILPDALGYKTQSDTIQKASTKVHLCVECGDKILHGCRQ